MATRRGKTKITAQVTLRGRYRPGTRVRLVKTSRPEALRATAADELLAVKKVDKDGVVQFTNVDGVEVGGRYFIVGHIAGYPADVRVRGREVGDEAGTGLPPVGAVPVRHGDGSLVGDRGGAGSKQNKPAVPAHPDPSGKDVQRASVVPESRPNAEPFPEERPAVPHHPDPSKKGK